MSNSKNKMPQEKAANQSMLETIVERVRRHLKDIHSKITDDDIRNSRINLDANPEKYYGELINR
jgi:hypothetical protein